MAQTLSRRAFLGVAPTPTRVVLLSLDGIRPDGLRQARTPNLDRLFARGTFSDTTRDVMPSVTLPNWTTILSGCGPEQHGVTANDWDRASPDLPCVAGSGGYVPSVFSVLKAQIPGVRTAFYWNWEPLIGPYDPASFDESAFEENDGYEGNCAKALAFLKANRDAPTLVFLYDVHTDHAGQRPTPPSGGSSSAWRAPGSWPPPTSSSSPTTAGTAPATARTSPRT